MKTKHIFAYLAIAIMGSLIGVFIYVFFQQPRNYSSAESMQRPAWETNMPDDFDPDNLDFTYAAERTVYGVVHVKTIRERDRREVRDPFEFFFGPRDDEDPEPETGFGSGVIVTPDGHIITNYHVIHEADQIEVTLHDQRTFTAEVIGEDPDTDIAMLEIDSNNLPYIPFGDSGDLDIGEWVLAVGNPFGLTSSVTAGIISAKERTLGVLHEGEMPIESFLQTDAAVNVGNSGGALVNLKGELVGVPTLIISPTRTNIGTAFAVPSGIVESVMSDIMEFGEVKRGVLGVTIMEVTSELADERDLPEIRGVYVESTVEGSAADVAGITGGDVILKIDGNAVNTTGELQQEVRRFHPGDDVTVTIIRDDHEMEVTATLISVEKHQELLMQQEEELLGATLRMVPEEVQERLNLPHGVQIVELEPGELDTAGVREGFIIVAINNQRVSEPADVVRLLEDFSGNVYLEGVYPDGTGAMYALSL